MSTIQSNQNTGNNYYSYTETNYNQGSVPAETPDNNKGYYESNDMVAFSDEVNQSQDSQKALIEQLNKSYKPNLLDKVAHLGRSDTEISAIKMKDDFLGTIKNGPQKDNPVSQFVMDTAVDFVQDKVGASVGLPGEIVSKAGESMMGCIENDNYLGALGNYKEWRSAHPNATKEEIRGYVQEQMGKPFNPMGCLSDSMNAGTLYMSDNDRKNYMNTKDCMLSAMMESSYKNMNSLYGNKW